jgi:hypothetical protein
VKQWTEWETIRRQVAIGGSVLDENEDPVAGATVALTATPKAFRMPVGVGGAASGGEENANLPDRTVTRQDGCYYFLDLPDGEYSLRALDPRSGRVDEKATAVSRGKKGRIKMTWVNFKLTAK